MASEHDAVMTAAEEHEHEVEHHAQVEAHIEEVVAACKEANAWEFIEKFPGVGCFQ